MLETIVPFATKSLCNDRNNTTNQTTVEEGSSRRAMTCAARCRSLHNAPGARSLFFGRKIGMGFDFPFTLPSDGKRHVLCCAAACGVERRWVRCGHGEGPLPRSFSAKLVAFAVERAAGGEGGWGGGWVELTGTQPHQGRSSATRATQGCSHGARPEESMMTPIRLVDSFGRILGGWDELGWLRPGPGGVHRVEAGFGKPLCGLKQGWAGTTKSKGG